MKDGHLGKCKACTRKCVRKNRASKVEYYRAYEHARGYHSKNPEYQREYHARNPEKYKAHNALNNAVRDGIVLRPSRCEMCDTETRLHGHHEDYSKPLEVNWLCTLCHKGPEGVHSNAKTQQV